MSVERINEAIAELVAMKETLGAVVFAREEADDIAYLYADAELTLDEELGLQWEGVVVGGEFGRDTFPLGEAFETLGRTIDGQLQVLRAAAGAGSAPLAAAVERAPLLDAALALAEAVLAEVPA